MASLMTLNAEPFSWSTFFESMISSTKGAISVILVMTYGFGVRRWGLVSAEGESTISKLGTTLFLPCLLFSEIGPLATINNMKDYWPIIPLTLIFQCLSLAVAGISRLLGMPEHFVPLFVFNNITSLPLLLIDTLSKSGSLDVLLRPGENMNDLVRRGRAYILVNALVGNLMRFALGPYLMKSHEHWVHSHPHHENPNAGPDGDEDKQGSIRLPGLYEDTADDEQEHQHEPADIKDMALAGAKKAKALAAKVANPPLVGGVLAVVCGLIPFLHSWLFKGGWLSPLSDSISNLGHLFSALQMFIIGAHIYSKKGSHASIPILIWLFAYRFFILPAISISTVYGIRKQWPKLMDNDLMLDYVLMTSNAGPPALTLSAIADMADLSSDINGQISRIITLSYVVTPLIAFPITGALTAIGLYKQ